MVIRVLVLGYFILLFCVVDGENKVKEWIKYIDISLFLKMNHPEWYIPKRKSCHYNWDKVPVRKIISL